MPLRAVATLAAVAAAVALTSAPAGAAEQRSVSLSRTTAPPGARMVVSGHGFGHGVRARVTLAGVRVKRGRTGPRGGFRFAVRVPLKPPGRYRVRVYSGGQVTGRRFRITRLPTEPTPLPTEPAPLPVSQPSPPAPPADPPPPPPPDPPTLVAAGDIACRPALSETATACHQARTANLIESLQPDAVAALGDNQYEHGELENFNQVYAPTWGRFTAITWPAIGNHEYEGDPERDSAPGYFGYFGESAGDPAKGYYRKTLGDWTIVVLNSGAIDYTRASGGAPALPDDCWPVSCQAGSEQEAWLRAELDQLPDDACVLAYWHHPRFSSGYGGITRDYPETGPLYRALYEHGAEIVLNGHAHNYERFNAVDPLGTADPASGITNFVVGTGGRSLFTDPGAQRETSATLYTDTFGVLELTLRPDGWSSRFVTDAGETRDAASGSCHAPPAPSGP